MTTTTLTVDAFTQLIRNKRDLYEACERNGYYLPKFKSTMIMEDNMRHVMLGKAFCPKRVDIRMQPCPRPPNKESLVDMFRIVKKDHINSKSNSTIRKISGVIKGIMI